MTTYKSKPALPFECFRTILKRTMSEDDEKDPSPRRGLTYALVSGFLASCAGSFAKLAMSNNEAVSMCELMTENYIYCIDIGVYLQIAAFILMLGLNAIMWTTFVKALRNCKTALEATVSNTAANFFSSAIIGQLVFEEYVTIYWWLGTLLIIFGLGLMSYSKHGGSIRGGSFKKYKSH